MIFRQLFDADSSTYTYILGCETTHEAVVIDPVFEQHTRDIALLRELSLNVKYSLDTHVHADHVTGAWLLKEKEGAEIALAADYEADGVDIALKDGMVLAFGDSSVTAMHTPGHTNGCFTFVTNDKQMAFPGDCLLIRSAGRTDFQAGDVHTMWKSIQDKIFSLPDDCLLYPAHDYMGRTVSTVAEEKRYNPRIGGDAREEDFVGYMNNLGLPHPRQLEIALPANLKCGRADESITLPDWAPITITFAGVPEVAPDWVARQGEAVCILDVRSQEEYNGELGHIEGSLSIPLGELRDRLHEVPVNRPVVVICQSGKRSAMATQILRSVGRDKVANIPGGILHWTKLALPGVNQT